MIIKKRHSPPLKDGRRNDYYTGNRRSQSYSPNHFNNQYGNINRDQSQDRSVNQFRNTNRQGFNPNTRGYGGNRQFRNRSYSYSPSRYYSRDYGNRGRYQPQQNWKFQRF